MKRQSCDVILYVIICGDGLVDGGYCAVATIASSRRKRDGFGEGCDYVGCLNSLVEQGRLEYRGSNWELVLVGEHVVVAQYVLSASTLHDSAQSPRLDHVSDGWRTDRRSRSDRPPAVSRGDWCWWR